MSGPGDDAALRARAYALFAELFLRGVHADVLPAVRAVPELSDALGPDTDEDASAAEHHALFDLQVFPHASVFLDERPRLGGPVAYDVLARLATVALGPPEGEEPDHAGHELGFLASLVHAEHGAGRSDDAPGVGQLRAAQRDFLDGHVLWWLPAFLHAVERHGPPFWTEVARTVAAVVLDHRAALGEPFADRSPPFGLAGPPADPLEDTSAGLAAIADFLATPSASGLWLSGADILELGRQDRLPVGFGGRTRTLTNLLRSAAGFERWGEVVDGLRGHVDRTREAFDEVDAQGPWARRFSEPWSRRLDATGRVLDRLEREVGGGAQPSPKRPR